MRHYLLFVGALLVSSLMATSAAAQNATIFVDYTHDTFFSGNATAKAALDAAALDVSNAITSVLGATTDTSTGVFGGSTATFNFQWSYTNPTSGATGQVVDPAVLPSNQIKVFAGARQLGTTTLGVGGPGGVSAQGSGTFTNQSEWDSAVANLSLNSTLNQGRGAGPAIFQFDGFFSGAPYSFLTGSTLGNITFDSDADWHFNHTTPVDPTKIDLYTVAVHELLHAIGFGGGVSWDAQVDGGNDWLGSEVIALLGTGTNVLHSDSSHISAGRMSRDIYNLNPQEAAMDPDVADGQRKYLTELDLAFLRDIGWATAIPEPASAFLVIGFASGLLLRRRRAA